MKGLLNALMLVGLIVVSPVGWAAGLVDALTSQVGVSESQASGGAGALLGYAQQELSPNDWTELTQYLPEAQQLAGSVDLGGSATSSMAESVGGMLGSDSVSSMAGSAASMGNMGSVIEAFSGLGLDPSMISQFAPVILDYLQQQGGSDLVATLTDLWQP